MVLRGRGGFGNYVHGNQSVPVSQAPVQYINSPSYKFRTGRGGFGNTVEASQCSFVTPDDYLREVKRSDTEPNRYMIGRGGLGNHIDRAGPRAERLSSVSSSDASSNGLTPYTTSPLGQLLPTSSRIWQKIKPNKTH